MLRTLLLAAVLAGAAASAANAATPAIAVTNVNLRAGPSTVYPAVTIVPAGAPITTFGCVAGYSWCDIGFGAYRGWVAAPYIQVSYGGAPVVLTAPLAPTVGITVVTFNRAYWDRYYVGYPWYGRWAAYPPYAPPRVTSAHRSVGCAGGTCVGVRGATGVYGGSTAQTRVCTTGSCTSTRVTNGPNGGTAARTRQCATGQGCTTDRAVVGPNGGVHTGSRTVQRP
ncbi:SH3 domain-containing protein [Aquabacter sp. L1I39]|uniref:SH3 domain-containing protein n=1 Tax=Aquabacter sp. L1I39 TaxID=2820278 RepID=UPI001ADA476D|nr:SH3 domain-containing protein [Aquabacter sp. L1I39]QTL02410.1 SH3 domain-containing protein [Aquabacter sp. L1I39]